ncbi:MAG: virulence factor BrkB family protein [Sedimenticola sp.]|nr:virulence factor BrkB family protein [Sedimenticola sp.]
MTYLKIRQFFTLLVTRFVADQGLPSAAALTFTTLLSIVPLMTVVLAIFAAFPVGDRVVIQLQDFIFNNFMPASGRVVQEYLNQFSKKAAGMTGPGLIFLIVVALLMMANIERAFNTIWRVEKKRRPLNRFMVYWAILTLGPLLIGLSVAVTSYLVTIPLFSDAASQLEVGSRLFQFMPLIASAVAFSLLYLVVPNQRVPVWHAVVGGVLASLLFELAKRGFAYYITNFPTYETIYGALAVIPLFLVWVYLSWVITLMGAEFSCCLGLVDEQGEFDTQGKASPLLLRFHLLRLLFDAQQRGESRSLQYLQQQLPGIGLDRLGRHLERLQQAHFVTTTEAGEWVLARDLASVTLLDLYQIEPGPLPDAELLKHSLKPGERVLGDIVGQVDHLYREAMARPIVEIINHTGGVSALSPQRSDQCSS